jgi:hypothetical protein
MATITGNAMQEVAFLIAARGRTLKLEESYCTGGTH